MSNRDIINKILEEDAIFQQDKVGTFCSECKRNTSVGLYPQYHVMSRTLCYHCAGNYYKLLTTLGFMEAPILPVSPKPRPKIFRRRFPLQKKDIRPL